MTAGKSRLPLPSFSLMLGALLAGLVFFDCIHQPLLADPDIGWHLRNAQYLAEQHCFLRNDPYTFSLHGHAWIDPEWLSETFFYAAWRWLGLRGLELLSILLIEAMALGVCLLAWQRTRSLRPALVAGSVWFLFASVSIAPRTQLFGWLCLIIELLILGHFRERRSGENDLLWALPPLFVVWINLHGSWPVGLVVLAIFLNTGLRDFRSGTVQATAWSAIQRRRLLLSSAICLAVLLINPYGVQLVGYPFLIAGAHPLTLATVQEWQSIDLHGTRGRIVFALVSALVAARFLRNRTWRLFDATVLVLAVAMGFTYSRFLLFTGIILCPLLAEEVTFLGRDKPDLDKRWLNAGIVALVAGFMLTHFPDTRLLTQQADRGYPVQAVAYLRQHRPAGALLNDFNWGGYLLWNDPAQPIFIDTRADVFEETGLLRTYVDLTNLQLPVESYNRGELRYVLFPRSAPLSLALARSPDWTVEYQDELAILYRRTR